MELTKLFAPLVAAALLVPALAQAADYPNKQIRLVVPFAPGTAADIVARSLADGLSRELANPVVVENRLGASGVIGADSVARSDPDGYTLLFTSPAHYFNASLYKKLPFDPVADFRPVVKISDAQLVLVVAASSPASTTRQLIDMATAAPGKLDYSSAGNGSTTQLSAALFTSLARIDVVHVPYKSGAQALTDVIGGQVAMTFTAVATALPHVAAKNIKALGVSGTVRSQSMPTVPTIAETLPGYDLVSWGGILAPAKTPDAIVERISSASLRVAKDAAFQQRLTAQGMEMSLMDAPTFAADIKASLPKWREIARISGAEPQ